jgi:hypothetical protein
MYIANYVCMLFILITPLVSSNLFLSVIMFSIKHWRSIISCMFATVEPEVTSSTFKSRRKVNSQNYIIYIFPLVVARR